MGYSWPVKPFGRQHPVRGFLNDPRIADGSRAFHFGIDISAPDGTPVYAVAPGTAHRQSKEAIAVVSPHETTFGYWHIVPAVAAGQHVALHQLLGHVAKGWGHVHFAERRTRGAYRNPLRRDGITPFTKGTKPTVHHVMFRRGNTIVEPDRVKGLVDICCEAFDHTPKSVPPPWHDMPVAPTLLHWRILRRSDDKEVKRWKIGVDFRPFRKAAAFHLLYTRDTRQNHPNLPGFYCYFLAHDWASGSLPNGDYVIEVGATDIRGNRGFGRFPFTIANGV